MPPCGAIGSSRTWCGEPFVGCPARIRNGRRRDSGLRPDRPTVQATTQSASRASSTSSRWWSPMQVAVDLHRERLGGRHEHVRGVVRVLDVAALHMPRRAEHLPRDPRELPPAQLADRQARPGPSRATRRASSEALGPCRRCTGRCARPSPRAPGSGRRRRSTPTGRATCPRSRPSAPTTPRGTPRGRTSLFVSGNVLVEAAHRGGVDPGAAVHGEVPAVGATEVQRDRLVVERLRDQHARALDRVGRQAERAHEHVRRAARQDRERDVGAPRARSPPR